MGHLSVNNSPKCMIKIFLESDEFSHKAGVTKHVTNTLAHKSQHNIQCNNCNNIYVYILFYNGLIITIS